MAAVCKADEGADLSVIFTPGASIPGAFTRMPATTGVSRVLARTWQFTGRGE
jgi:hypothetical protein